MHEKERKQEDAYTKTQTHNPIPTSLFLSSPQCISCSQFKCEDVFSLPNAFTTNKQNFEQRCRDGVMNEFVSLCRHLLVSFLFHEVTSLHPPSFHRNDFSTCSTHFSFILVQSPKVYFAQRSRRLHARACARGEPTRARTRRAQCQPWKTAYGRSWGTARERSVSVHARCPCTPQSTVETFGEEISAEAFSGKEIAGLLRKIMMMMVNMMTRKL